MQKSIDIMLFSGMCPATHPNAYNMGSLCCANSVEGPLGSKEGCTGKDIRYSSSCCLNDTFMACPEDICVSHMG